MKIRFRPAVRRRGALAASLLLLLLAAGTARAQTPDQIRQQIEALGLQNMSPDQIRQRLTQLGFDPSILDSYLRGQVQREQLTPSARTAVEALTVTPAENLDQAPLMMGFDPESTRELSYLERETGLRVYGMRTFSRASTQFETPAMGPVPPGYVLGPGDEVVLIMTGDVEQQMVLPVTREGFILIPQAGKVWVNGLTLAELRERLYGVLGRVYSGVGRGPEATTQFEATLGRPRANQVFVTGEVRYPGSVFTSAMASVLNALYKAGGPLPTGSFRDVRVLRNGELVERVDLYDYLTRGRNMADVILNPGDVLFVPPPGTQVALRGAVTREAIYELQPDETLLDVIAYAGGLAAPAALGRARITRILPPGMRTEPGVDRTIVDVDLGAVIRGEVPVPELYDGDEVRIFRVRPEVRKVITVAGAVWKDCSLSRARPVEQEPRVDLGQRAEEPAQEEADTVAADTAANGARNGNGRAGGRTADRDARERQQSFRPQAISCSFHYYPGMRAWDAIEAAEGLRPEAYRDRAQIVRVDPQDSTLSILPFSLETSVDGTPLENPTLQEFDAIRVFSRTDFQDSLSIRISGEVRRPGTGTFEYREGMTLEDLLLQAGGLTPEADLVIEVSRRPGPQERRQGRLAETVRIPVDQSYIISEEGIRFYAGDRVHDEHGDNGGEGSRAARFVLRPHDQVFVRRVPHLADTERTVRIQGEVIYPGVYALRSKDERLSQLVERAGGLASTAFADGFRLYREGQLVNIELPEALEAPGGEADLILLPGDSMVVPEYDPVVVVQGAVNSPAAVLYKEGADLDYYIANAGGYARNADRDAVNVRYANGEGAVREKTLIFTRSPKPGPGSVVNVPVAPEGGRDFLSTIGTVAQAATTITALLLALSRF